MRSFIQKRFVYVFSGEYIVKSGTLEFDTDQGVTNFEELDDMSHNKEYRKKRKNGEEKLQITPRKRKPYRTLENVDQILDNVNTFQYSDKKKNILKLRYEKTENVEVQNVNEEEKLQITPRKRKPQRTLENVDQILDNVNTFQYSNAKKNTLKFRTRKE
jgi:hypothetical protein